MSEYGLVGQSLGHSFSARYFAEKFAREGIVDATYTNFPLASISELSSLLLSHPDLRGFNVTIPYKEAVMPFLAWASAEVRTIAAVNCVKVTPEGSLRGFNTDAYGFDLALTDLIGKERPRALVLGTGGAAKAVGYALEQRGIPYRYVSRTPGTGRITYAEVTPATMRDIRLIVNTTPLGTAPDVELCPPIPYESLAGDSFLFDLVYNPETTEFMRRGIARGARVCNGYTMLAAQAERSWEIWNDPKL